MTNQQPVDQAKKILVVDDNLVIRKVVEMKLKAHGYGVTGAADASAAVSAVKKEKPDLILLDLVFPPDPLEVSMSWDGFGILRWLHAGMSGAQDIPVVIISGTDPAKNRDVCLKAGASAYLRKPLDMDELIATIRTVLGEKQTEAAV